MRQAHDVDLETRSPYRIHGHPFGSIVQVLSLGFRSNRYSYFDPHHARAAREEKEKKKKQQELELQKKKQQELDAEKIREEEQAKMKKHEENKKEAAKKREFETELISFRSARAHRKSSKACVATARLAASACNSSAFRRSVC
jgi:hypothetical protein